MQTKLIIILAIVVAVVGVGTYLYTQQPMAVIEDSAALGVTPSDRSGDATLTATGETLLDRRVTPTDPASTPSGKLKVVNFRGTLESLDTGCYVDGECFVVVDGKHITTTLGWRQEVVGSSDFAVLEKQIGKRVDVYAQDKGDGTYTLYGSEGFYVKPAGATTDPNPDTPASN